MTREELYEAVKTERFGTRKELCAEQRVTGGYAPRLRSGISINAAVPDPLSPGDLWITVGRQSA